MNINPNQHITEFLNYYCSLPTAPQYAVMLKGKWGSGKTHFINEYKDILDKKEKKYIYVSLYGVTSYDEIETKFLEVLHPKLYNKKTILARKLANGFLKATLKFDLDDDGKPDGTVTSQIPSLDANDLLDTKDYILIFDDLERCSININDLLGYINYFVEHQEYKVILLANDEKFKSEEYKEIKEKLIGKTFEVVSNTELAYVSFIKEIKDNSIFLDYKENIIKIYEQSGYHNLRVFRQVILDFDRFYNEILKQHSKKQNLISDFLDDFLKKSLDYRNGKQIKSKMPNNTSITIISSKLDEKQWINIIEKSFYDKKRIEKFIQFKYYITKNSPVWIQLYNFRDLEDEELETLIQKAEIELTNDNILPMTDIRRLFGLLIFFTEQDFYNKTPDEIWDYTKNKINVLFKKDYKNIFFNRNIYLSKCDTSGTPISYENEIYMNKYFEYLTETMNKYELKINQDNWESINNNLDTITTSISRDFKVLEFINIEQLVNHLKSAEYYQINKFTIVLKSIIDNNNFINNLYNKIENLKFNSKIRQFIFNELKTELDSIKDINKNKEENEIH